MLATWGMRYWPIFLLASSAWIVIGFAVPETIAIVQGSHNSSVRIDNTLSYYARHELNVSAQMTIHTVAWYVTLVLWLVFVVFITFHIWFDQFG